MNVFFKNNLMFFNMKSISYLFLIISLLNMQANSNISDDINNIGLGLLKQIYATEKGLTNIFLSPFSIASVLSMIQQGSGGQTQIELDSLLPSATKPDKSLIWANILGHLNSDNQFVLNSANVVLMKKEFKINQEYGQLLTGLYHAKCESVDFKDQTIVDKVNYWTKQITGNNIQEMVKKFDPNTIMILLNAIYFKGLWLRPFVKTETKKKMFKNFGNKETDVLTMRMENKVYEYFNDTKNQLEFLAIPYVGNDLNFYIVLPKTGDFEDMNRVLDLLTTNGMLNGLFKSASKSTCDLYLPRFKFNTDYHLGDSLKKIGLNTLFTPKANLSGISSDIGLYLSQFHHKAVIDVEEHGSEAAAISGADVLLFSSLNLDSFEFIVNRPFIFFIKQKSNDLILFLGIVNQL